MISVGSFKSLSLEHEDDFDVKEDGYIKHKHNG